MKVKSVFSAMALTATLLGSVSAHAWTAYHLGKNKWAIECANGQMFSYSGSSAGLDTVGPALCPGGLTGPGGNRPVIVNNPPAEVRQVVEGDGGCTPVFPLPRGVSNAKVCKAPKRIMRGKPQGMMTH